MNFFEDPIWELQIPGFITGVSIMLYVYWTHFGGSPEISKVEKREQTPQIQN